MQLLVLNEKFQTVDEADKYESVIWTDRFSSYGDFEIYTATDKRLLENLKTDYYLWSDHTEHGMIIEDRKIETDVEEGNRLIVSGRSFESILLRRIIWSQTVLNGTLQSQIKKLLDQNVINPSNKNRAIPNFIFEETDDPYIASIKIRAQFTGDVLYDAIKKLCDSVQVGFKITLNKQNQFVFKLYSGVDRSYDQNVNPFVVFSPNFENVVDSSYYESKRSFKNVTLVAGEGSGASRKTYTVGDNTLTGLKRRELYTDARDISSNTSSGTLDAANYNVLLKQRGLESLAENTEIKSLDGEVETTQLYRYGEDFFMGDIVQLENIYEIKTKVRVTEFIHSEDTNGIKTYPTFEIIE